MKKADWIVRGAKKEAAFTEIARLLGENHRITRMMGTLAWGRHTWELGPNPLQVAAIRRDAALDGYFSALNLWARDNDQEAQKIMIHIWYQPQ